MTARFVALVAGVLFFFLAVFTQGILTLLEPSARNTDVTAVVRTDLGQLKWMLTDATDYTPLQQRGRRVYLSEGCWYCHSQYVRPVTGETRRWGPVSEAGEYAFDVPHLFGTRRIGPDLTRVGLKYGDEWHYAHFWNPRMLSEDSIMQPRHSLSLVTALALSALALPAVARADDFDEAQEQAVKAAVKKVAPVVVQIDVALKQAQPLLLGTDRVAVPGTIRARRRVLVRQTGKRGIP